MPAANIREQGPPAPRGLPGATPVFQIGTVVSGLIPQVSIVQVNPLLYTLNFVIPTTGTNIANLWTAIQTFQRTAVFQNGLTALLNSTMENLNITGTLTVSGNGVYVGLQAFTALASFNGGIVVTQGATIDNLTVGGDTILEDVSPLTVGQCYVGQLYLDTCGKVRVVAGAFPNNFVNSGNFSTMLTPGSTETAMSVTVPFTVPSSCTCGTAPNVNIAVHGLLEFAPSADVLVTQNGSPPYNVTAGAVQVSLYTMRLRLDNATTGALIYSSSVSNLDAARNFITEASSIAPGAHVLYVTLQGNGGGSQPITAVGLSASVEF